MDETLESKLFLGFLHLNHMDFGDRDFFANMYRGTAAFFEKEYDAAIQCFEEAKKLDDNPICDLYLGRSHAALLPKMKASDYKETLHLALEGYSNYLSGNFSAEVFSEVVDMLFKVNQKKSELQVKVELDQFLEKGSLMLFDNPKAQIKIAKSYRQLGEKKQAYTAIMRAAHIADIDEFIDTAAVWMFYRTSKNDKLPLTVFEERLKKIKDPAKAGEFAYSLGTFLCDSDNADEVMYIKGISYLEKAYKYRPKKFKHLLKEIEDEYMARAEVCRDEKYQRVYEKKWETFRKDFLGVKEEEEVTQKMKIGGGEQEIEFVADEIPLVHQLATMICDYVVAQNKAVEDVAYVGVSHLERIAAAKNGIHIDELPPKEILLGHGPSGVGKTFAAETLAKVIKVPITIYDATQLSETGYVGGNPQDIIADLWNLTNGDIEAIQKSIIVVDEIDKKASRGSVIRDVSGAGAQNHFLRMMEGTMIKFQEHVHAKPIYIDTSYMGFMFFGSFAGVGNSSSVSLLDSIVASRLDTKKIGFAPSDPYKEYMRTLIGTNGEGAARFAQDRDFRAFGMMPELMNRITMITYFNNLNTNDLRRIMTEPKGAIMNRHLLRLKRNGVNVIVEKEALDLIAEKAWRSGESARVLDKIITRILQPLHSNLPGSTTYEFNISKEYVEKQLDTDDMKFGF